MDSLSVEVSETGEVEITGSDGTIVTCLVNVLRGDEGSFAVLEEQGREPPIFHFWEYRLENETAVVSPIKDPDIRRQVAARYAAGTQ